MSKLLAVYCRAPSVCPIPGASWNFEDHVAAVYGDSYPSVSELGECHVSPEAFVVFFHWLSLFSYDLCGHSQYNM